MTAAHDVPPAVLARSFGTEAARYDQARPSYPAAALERVLAALRRPPEPRPAAGLVDVGAGTGKLTALLVDRAAEVVAVEPDPQMLAVLTARLPQVRALPGSAESHPAAGRLGRRDPGRPGLPLVRPAGRRPGVRPGAASGRGGRAAVERPGPRRGLGGRALPGDPQARVHRRGSSTRWTPTLFGPVEEAEVPSAHRLAGPDGAARPGAQLELGDHPARGRAGRHRPAAAGPHRPLRRSCRARWCGCRSAPRCSGSVRR